MRQNNMHLWHDPRCQRSYKGHYFNNNSHDPEEIPNWEVIRLRDSGKKNFLTSFLIIITKVTAHQFSFTLELQDGTRPNSLCKVRTIKYKNGDFQITTSPRILDGWS